ncbi:Cadherin-18 [Varanus komodoensis]|nr:Cadherin-18 [Varanus komodoensis]
MDKCIHCQVFTRQARKNRENCLKKILWNQALLVMEEVTAGPSSAAPSADKSIPPPHTPSLRESAGTEGKCQEWSHSLKKKKEKRMHSGTEGTIKAKWPKKDKPEHWHKKYTHVPQQNTSELPITSVASEPSVRQFTMQVTPPPSTLCMASSPRSSPEGPEPTARTSISDGKICESPTDSPPLSKCSIQATTERCDIVPPASVPTRHLSTEVLPRAPHHPPMSHSDPSHRKPRRYWMPLPYRSFDPNQFNQGYPWECYPPYDYPYPSPPMQHRCSQASTASQETPSTLAAAMPPPDLSPARSSSSSPPYLSDSNTEESKQASTSPDLLIPTQGLESPSDNLGNFLSSWFRCQHISPDQDNIYNVIHTENAIPLHSNSDKGDGSVKYILTGEGAGTIFIIDDTTGDIHSTKSLDREKKTHYVLHAQAIDRRTNKPLEPESEFIIKVQDINDNAPKFTDGPYIVTVPEMSDMGPDELHPRVIKELVEELSETLAIIFDKSWNTGEVQGLEKG